MINRQIADIYLRTSANNLHHSWIVQHFSWKKTWNLLCPLHPVLCESRRNWGVRIDGVIRHQTDHNSRNHHVEEAAQGQGQAHPKWKIPLRILHLEITLINQIKGDHITAQKR